MLQDCSVVCCTTSKLLLQSGVVDIDAIPMSSEMCCFPGSVRGKLADWPSGVFFCSPNFKNKCQGITISA